jgi:hypothetical protein
MLFVGVAAEDQFAIWDQRALCVTSRDFSITIAQFAGS